MDTILDYPAIDKACNGTFIFYNNEWHRLIVVDGRCYNHGLDSTPNKGELVINNSDLVHDQLIITKQTFKLDWINSLPVSTIGCSW